MRPASPPSVRPLALLAPLLLPALSGCGGAAPAPGAERLNVLVVAIDTLRADRLGAYGYPRPTSPRLDALAAESVVFEHAVAPASWTLPSFASVLTSLPSTAHECWEKDSRLGEAFLTLPEILRAAGWHTAGVASHVFFQERYGLQQGFESFDAELTPRRGEPGHVAVTSHLVADRALDWLAEHGDDGPWLLWLHFFDPHFLYHAHEEWADAFGTETEEERYDGEIAYTDRHVGRVLDALRERGRADDTIVVLVADHGEAFGEHGTRYHGRTLFREETGVPLLVRVPGAAPRRVTTPVGTIDVLPTLLDLLGLPAPSGVQGRSLAPFVRGAELAPVPLLSEVRLFEDHRGSSVVRGDWKLVVDESQRRTYLFDLAADPLETKNLAKREPELVAELQRARRDLLLAAAAAGEAYEKPPKLELDESEIDSLRDLGYVDDEP